ncbi:MAG: hypothetical protein HPY46_06595 [Candidatus Aminicenantes bacterium]|uniref:Outer membrane protein beta-barrel domain-containing protein n=1 Tax=Candidatus Saccharicenans subterraneus TaxID=2508984 RepID=A0A3E2BQU4_9BACT|nr:hypothetical protein [Candidatus Aminicenantes bacterium]RFT17143.1 MAG: hypothetical protein OP8BY_1085 [Candidatus Saccharicenans subterraneum]
MKKGIVFILLAGAMLLGTVRLSFGQWFVDLENGAVLSGYNDVAIPGDTGTRFSLSEELKTDAAYFFRFRAGYQWKSRHTISVLFAPLTLKAAGSLDRPLFFYEELFPAGTPLTGRYKFNSYRLTYRYDFVRKGRWQVGVGLTAKIRDAAIKIEGGGLSSTKTNVGFVPLINLRVFWQFHDRWGLLLEGDGAVAKQGRAEDFLLALQWKVRDNLSLKFGYRILEGGADVEEVYSFSLLHYLSAGLTFTF